LLQGRPKRASIQSIINKGNKIICRF